MNRVEAVIFASGSIVQREDLHQVIGADANLDKLIEDIQAELKGRPYELVSVGEGGCIALVRNIRMPLMLQLIWVKRKLI